MQSPQSNNNNLNWSNLVKGLVGVGIIIVIFAMFSNRSNSVDSRINNAVRMCSNPSALNLVQKLKEENDHQWLYLNVHLLPDTVGGREAKDGSFICSIKARSVVSDGKNSSTYDIDVGLYRGGYGHQHSCHSGK